MRSFILTALVVCGAGCATAQHEKIQFGELFPPEPEAASTGPELPAGTTSRPKKRLYVKQVKSAALRSALITFSERQRSFRAQFKGQPFPAQAMKNWWTVLDGVEDFLSARQTPTQGHDARLAREILDVEMEADARTFTGFPRALAENVNAQVGRLALRSTPAPRPRTVTGNVRYIWPLHPVAVTSLFGRRLHPIQGEYRVHFGVDLRAAEGQPVAAAGPGRVVRAGWNGGHGKQVEILHEGGVVTRYSHLSRIVVKLGLEVRQGDVLGAAGETGQATGTHLHFEFWRSGRPCDPVVELGPDVRPSPQVASRE